MSASLNRLQSRQVLAVLQRGTNLNAFDARFWYGVKNLRARIYDLRRAGYSVYTNRVNGQTFYRLGKPSREQVAKAHRIYGAKLFR